MRWSPRRSPARTRSPTRICCGAARWTPLFGGVRAPSTLGTFLRCFTFGDVRQLDAVAARLLPELARLSPLLTGADQLAWVDIDSGHEATYGYANQGAGYGYSSVPGSCTAALRHDTRTGCIGCEKFAVPGDRPVVLTVGLDQIGQHLGVPGVALGARGDVAFALARR